MPKVNNILSPEELHKTLSKLKDHCQELFDKFGSDRDPCELCPIRTICYSEFGNKLPYQWDLNTIKKLK